MIYCRSTGVALAVAGNGPILQHEPVFETCIKAAH